jgi:hypothetical protein
MGRLLDVIEAAYEQLGFDEAFGSDTVFEQLVTPRIVQTRPARRTHLSAQT